MATWFVLGAWFGVVIGLAAGMVWSWVDRRSYNCAPTLPTAVARKRLPPVLLLMLAGCYGQATSVYGIDVAHSEQLPHQAEVVALVSDAYQVEIDPTVWWTDTTCKGKPAVIRRNTCYNGYTYDCARVIVAEHPTLGESALVHELAHCARIELHGDGDASHSDVVWWGLAEAVQWHVKEVGW